jgi:hypothetical protein
MDETLHRSPMTVNILASDALCLCTQSMLIYRRVWVTIHPSCFPIDPIPTRLTLSQERSYATFPFLSGCGSEEWPLARCMCPKVNRPIERSKTMNMPIVRGEDSATRKRKRTVRPAKIRWDRLGLQDPALGKPTPSMEDIRRQVTSLASRGLGTGTRSRTVTKDAPARTAADIMAPNRKRRRGATE